MRIIGEYEEACARVYVSIMRNRGEHEDYR